MTDIKENTIWQGESMDRDYLIDLCEKSIVSVSKRMNRDTPDSQSKVWKLWSLLKCGCDYKILYEWTLVTDEYTIWIEVYYPDFNSFEYWFDLEDRETLSYDNFYIPTEKKLKERDWEDRY